MYCTNCGRKMEDHARFCKHCGAAAEQPGQEVRGQAGQAKPGNVRYSVPNPAPGAAPNLTPGVTPNPMPGVAPNPAPGAAPHSMPGGVPYPAPEEKKKDKKRLLPILLGIFAVIAVVGIAVAVWMILSGKNTENQAEEQLKLGNRYLEEMNYEQAVVAFTKTIEIDPAKTDAYIGASEAYVGLENYKDAVEILESGYERAQDTETIREEIQEVCLEAVQYYVSEDNYEEAEKYVEKGKEYGGTEDLEGLLAAQPENAETEAQPQGVQYSWALNPDIEADSIYYLNNDDVIMYPINLLHKQMEDDQGYAVIQKGGAYGLIDMDGNLLDGINFQSVATMASKYLVVYPEPREFTPGFTATDYILGNNGLDMAISYGAIMPEMQGGIYLWRDGLLKQEMFSDNPLADPEVPIPLIRAREDIEGFSGRELIVGCETSPEKYAVYANGALVTDFIYDECGSYSDGLLAVCQDGKWGYIDGNGELVIPMEYDASWQEYVPIENSDSRETEEYCYAASGGYVVLRQGENWELRDVQGGLVIPQGEFEAIRPVKDGKCWVKKDGKWGVIQLP